MIVTLRCLLAVTLIIALSWHRTTPCPLDRPHNCQNVSRFQGGIPLAAWALGRAKGRLTVSPFFSVPCHSRGFGQSNSLPTAGSVGGGMGRRNPRQYQIPSRNVPSARLGLLGTSGFVSSTQRNTTANPTIMKQGRQVCSAPGRGWAAKHRP